MKKTTLIAFNKPYGVLCQFSGEGETLAAYGFPRGVYAAGRLDKDSEGLLLLTDDGDLNQKIANPKYAKEKIYHVQVEGIPSTKNLTKLASGVVIKGYTTRPCQVELCPDLPYPARNPPIRERKNIPTSWLKLTLSEGKNRQVRRMTAAIGHPTLRLIRYSICGYELTPNLASGTWKAIEKSSLSI